MALWKFRENEDIEELLLRNIPDKLILPGTTKNQVAYFQNGDRMTVNLETRELDWDPVTPGEMCSSRLSMKLHQWFGKGIIYPVQTNA